MRFGRSLLVLTIIWITSCGVPAGPPSKTDLADVLFDADEVPLEGRWAIDEDEDHEFVSACEMGRFIQRHEPLADVERVYKYAEIIDREPNLEALDEFDPTRVEVLAVRLLTFEDADRLADRFEDELDRCVEEKEEDSAALGSGAAMAMTVRRVEDRSLPDDYRLDATTWRQVNVIGVQGQGASISPNVSEMFVDDHVIGLVRSSSMGKVDDLMALKRTEGLVGEEIYDQMDIIVNALLDRL